MSEKLDFSIENVGKRTVDSPLDIGYFVEDEQKVLYDISIEAFYKYKKLKTDPLAFEVAGPRKKIYFDPSKTKAGIVTCGGLCPGINDVIRGVVNTLYYGYGVKNILGFRYGYQGLVPKYGHEVVTLTPDTVTEIHKRGGSILSSSRGPQDIGVMTDALERMNVDILFTIGGDGTQKGALEIHHEARRRKSSLCVVGIPKTIDNDLSFIEKSFGFETAFGAAVESIRGAHEEAEGAPNGIGIVKLMGRHSGFIAAMATLAMSDVNFCLVPESPFRFDGEHGLFAIMEKRLEKRRHAVVVVAEGAGQELMAADENGKDASGNVKLSDIGVYLKDRLGAHFKSLNIEVNIKYIDPSYIIRSVPANSTDSVYCMQLAQNAVHAAIAGKSGMVVGELNNVFTHVPVEMATLKRNIIDVNGPLWSNVLETTGQPQVIG